MSLQDQVKHNYSHDPNDVVVVHGLGTEQETEIRLHVSGGVTVNTKQSVTVNSENVEVNATATTLNSNLQVNGTINSTGIIKSDVDVQGNTVSLVGHIHPFVGTGPGVASTTSAPTP
jgi:phage baseplate assembly protein gpV